MRKSWRKALLSTLVAMVVIGIGFARTETATALDLDSPLLTTNRSRLEICIEVEGGNRAASSLAHKAIVSSLDSIKSQDLWNSTPYRSQTPTITLGCGRQGRLLQGKAHYRGAFGDPSVDIVSTPSRYRTMVFVASSDQSKPRIQALPFRLDAEEMLCESQDACAEVTTGLYITVDELADQELVADGLLKGIGLLPPFPVEEVVFPNLK